MSEDWLDHMARKYPLHAAAAGGDHDEVRTLLAGGVEVDGTDDDGWTALSWAASADVASLLLAAGADPHHADEYGDSVLMAVSRRTDAETVRVIINAGVSPNEADSTGNVALGEAASAGNVETVEALIAHGADVDAETRSGQTPLWAAAREGHAEIVDALLGAGADPARKAHIGDLAGRTAADQADAGGHTDVAKRIRAAIEAR